MAADRERGTVTLVTGDKVTVTPVGKSWTVGIEPARRLGRPETFIRQVSEHGVRVIPSSVVPLLRAKKLDPALFDVTGLIRQKLDDAHVKAVPLLVEAPTRRAAASLGKVTRVLGGGKLTAVTADEPLELAELNGVRVWLNGRARPSLDVSVPQVGAPAAWAAGHTGAGVTAAVLDTGYDAAHPDLRGVVKAEQDFTGEGVQDTHGHGTHVASILAGRGTASGGRYQGIAKGADLIVGKVCGTGDCPYDAIIAGMQWAAAAGARVVNLSLGGYPDDGTDPVSLEVNRLTESTGTLFVVAAGNQEGTGPCKVTSPATADAALAVASVTKQDAISDFSCAGPRNGDAAMKPDLAAPGSDIVAARAAGTLPDNAVDEQHARLSGTSMAAPHVAGAAAILAGQHPDWKASQLKSALMGSARPVQGSVYGQGAGRLDLARAIGQPVTAETSSVGFGLVRWPFKEAPKRQAKLTYRNDSDQPITLTLEAELRTADNRPAPVGLVSLAETSVTVPARGVATVPVEADPARGEAGVFGGRVVARSADGKVVQTPLGISLEVETYNLTTVLKDRNGEAPDNRNAEFMLQSLDDPKVLTGGWSGDRRRVPAGRYLVLGLIHTPRPGRPGTVATAGAIEVDLRRDETVTMDARQGRRQHLEVEAPDARLVNGALGIGVKTATIDTGMLTGLDDEHYLIPLAKGPAGLVTYTRAIFEQPWVRLTGNTGGPEVPVEWVGGPVSPPGTQRLRVVDAGRARPEDLVGKDLRGALASFTLTREDGDSVDLDERIATVKAAGAVVALYRYIEPIQIRIGNPLLPLLATKEPQAAQLAGQVLDLRWSAGSAYRYDFALPQFGQIPADTSYRPRNRDLAAAQSRFDLATTGDVGWYFGQSTAGGVMMDQNMFSLPIRLPARRTQYYNPGAVTWQPSLGFGEHSYRSLPRTYQAGERTTEVWNKPVLGPAFDRSVTPGDERPRAPYRLGDTLDVVLPLLSDSAGRTGLPGSRADKGSVVLAQDGREIGRSDEPGVGVFTLPAGDHRYTLTADVRRADPSWPLATEVRAQWNFRSATTAEPEVLRLLSVRMDPALDQAGRTVGGRKFSFPVTTTDSGTVRSVEVSYDDGATWQSAELGKTASGWTATVRHPRSGFVSLRAHASGQAGDDVTQTTIRAYGLK